MCRKIILIVSAASALILNAFSTEGKKAIPQEIFAYGYFSCDVISLNRSTSYFTLLSFGNQASITSISGRPHFLWQTSTCTGAGNEVFFDDPFQ